MDILFIPNCKMERYLFCRKIQHAGQSVSLKEKKVVVALVGAFLLWGIALFFLFSGKSELVFLSYSEKAATGQLRWNTISLNGDYSEAQSFCLKKQTYQTFDISIPGDICQIRTFRMITGNETDNLITLHYILLKKNGYVPLSVPLSSVTHNGQIANFRVTNVMQFVTTGCHPEIVFDKPAEKMRVDWLAVVGCLLGALFFSFFVLYGTAFLKGIRITRGSCLISASFVVVALLAVTMALNAGFNASPDERDHFMAADYYKTHTQTPARNIESGIYTYNDLWNYSRVYLKGFDYIAAGKFSNLFDGRFESYQSVRFWGIVMLLFFALLALIFPRQSLILLPLLLTPQLWYLFSSVNDSSMPLFLSLILLIVTESGKRLLLNGKNEVQKYLLIIFLGLLLGVLFLSKENYYLFVLFYLLYLFLLPVNFSGGIVVAVSGYFQSLMKHLKMPLLIVVIAIAVVVVKNLSIERQATPLSPEAATYFTQIKGNFDQHIASGISGEARFGSYFKMLPSWLSISCRSFISAYGYMQYWGSNFFYYLNDALYFILISGSLFFVVKNRNREKILWCCVCFLFLLGMVFASSYIYSYRYDFQAQGRYLFPIMPILGFTLYKQKEDSGEKFTNRFVFPISAVLFLLGIYSFIFIGLASIG